MALRLYLGITKGRQFWVVAAEREDGGRFETVVLFLT
jgi:hypothetical protein